MLWPLALGVIAVFALAGGKKKKGPATATVMPIPPQATPVPIQPDPFPSAPAQGRRLGVMGTTPVRARRSTATQARRGLTNRIARRVG